MRTHWRARPPRPGLQVGEGWAAPPQPGTLVDVTKPPPPTQLQRAATWTASMLARMGAACIRMVNEWAAAAGPTEDGGADVGSVRKGTAAREAAARKSASLAAATSPVSPAWTWVVIVVVIGIRIVSAYFFEIRAAEERVEALEHQRQQRDVAQEELNQDILHIQRGIRELREAGMERCRQDIDQPLPTRGGGR